jgi:ABC-2 type transport system ATP-binding protein
MSEMEDTADHLVVIGRGKLIEDAPIRHVIGASSLNAVTVRSPQAEALRHQLIRSGMQATQAGDSLLVTGASTDEIGDLAFHHRIPIHELSPRLASLEEAYMELTRSAADYAVPVADESRGSSEENPDETTD